MIRIFTLNYPVNLPPAKFNININTSVLGMGPLRSILYQHYIYFYIILFLVVGVQTTTDSKEVVGEEDYIIETILILYTSGTS